MKYNTLGRTDLTVSEICLGTMTWGSQNDEAEAFAQMDHALESGVNFIDTAELYPTTPLSPETYGATETIIGNWVKARGNRSQVVALAPESEISRYAIDIRSITHGTGDFTRESAGYAPLPAALAKKLMEG